MKCIRIFRDTLCSPSEGREALDMNHEVVGEGGVVHRALCLVVVAAGRAEVFVLALGKGSNVTKSIQK